MCGMSLCLAVPEEREYPRSAVRCADCACDSEKLGTVRAYVQEHFPDRSIREFHSHSTVRHGGVPVPCADHHVISISDDRPCCAVLAPEFLDQSVGMVDECLRGWDLATALRVDCAVMVGRHGLTPL
jgi:hypothetical protein